MALEYSKEKRLRANDRDFAVAAALASFLDNHDDALDDDPNVPDQIPYRDARFWDSGPAGAAERLRHLGTSMATMSPGTSGRLPLLQPVTALPFHRSMRGRRRRAARSGHRDSEPTRIVHVNALSPTRSTPAARLFADVKYSKTKAFSEVHAVPISSCSWSPTTPNAAEHRRMRPPEAMDAAGVARQLRHGDPRRGHRADTRRVVAGIEGDLDAGDALRGVAGLRLTEVENLQTNNRLNDRFAAALDAVVDPDTAKTSRSNSILSHPFNLEWNGWDGFLELYPGPGPACLPLVPDSGCVPVNILAARMRSR